MHQDKLNLSLLMTGFEANEMETNGNCIFESISWELKQRLALDTTVPQLRESVLNLLTEKIDEYIKFFHCDNCEKEEQHYLNEIEQLKSSEVCKNQLSEPVMRAVANYYIYKSP